MHGLTRMANHSWVTRTLASTWCSNEVIALAWPWTHLKAGNHTNTLQMDGFVICRRELMTHWYTIFIVKPTL